MTERMQRLEKWLLKIPIGYFIMLMWLLSFAITILGFLIAEVFLGYHIPNPELMLKKYGLIKAFFGGVILAPIIETFIFQYGLQNILLMLTDNRTIVIFFSALIFASLHYLNGGMFPVFSAFIGGLILAWTMFFAPRKGYSGFWIVCTIHAVNNAIAMVVGYLE